MTYENDVLEIPKGIKEMSVAELEKAGFQFFYSYYSKSVA